MTIDDVCDEINHTYPHLTRGLSRARMVMVLSVYWRPFEKVPKIFWRDILDDFHRRSLFVRPANVHAAIDEVIGEAGYDVPRPRLVRTQLDAYQEMKINEKRQADWEENRRRWVKRWLRECASSGTGMHKHGGGEGVSLSHGAGDRPRVVALRPVS